jgi:heat shock protein HslJ
LFKNWRKSRGGGPKKKIGNKHIRFYTFVAGISPISPENPSQRAVGANIPFVTVNKNKHMKQLRLIMGILSLLALSSELVAQNKKVVTRRTRVSKTVVKPPEPEQVDTVVSVMEVKQPGFDPQLKGRWKLLSIRKQQKDNPSPLPEGLYIVFNEDGTVNGHAGCNSFGGSYQATGASLLLQNLAATKMACDRLDVETLVMRHLGQLVKRFATDGADKMTLRDGTGSVVFECEREKGR